MAKPLPPELASTSRTEHPLRTEVLRPVVLALLLALSSAELDPAPAPLAACGAGKAAGAEQPVRCAGDEDEPSARVQLLQHELLLTRRSALQLQASQQQAQSGVAGEQRAAQQRERAGAAEEQAARQQEQTRVVEEQTAQQQERARVAEEKAAQRKEQARVAEEQAAQQKERARVAEEQSKVVQEHTLVAEADEGAATTVTTTLPPTGLTLNAVGDLKTFATSVIMYYGATIVCIIGFSVMRLRYPVIYQHNAMQGLTPSQPGEGFFGWYLPAMSLTIDEIAEHITLDHAMLIEYSHLGMKLMTCIGIPMFFGEGALNWAFGGLAAGQDHLSYLSFGNVQNSSWLYWVHCFVVWAVVIFTTWCVHDSMRKFLPRRYKWLRALSEIRANTVLVEGIPEEYRSDAKVRSFFEELLPGAAVKSVDFVKDTSALEALVAARDNALYKLHAAEAEAAAHPEERPTIRESFMGTKVEAVPYWRRQADDLEPQVKRERQRITAESKKAGGVNLSTAFVTFASRTHAELALRLDGAVTLRQDEWSMLTAPDSTDILWADLSQDDTARSARAVIGYLLVIVLYFLYMPIVIFVTNLGKMVDLTVIGLGSLQSVWDGVAPTMGLQFMIAFLPTFLILIFKAFFTCMAEAHQQHKLQIWYFWFQVVFVILATAVGQNFRVFAATCVTEPMAIIPVLADTMPYATHYYMNYLVLQAMSHGMNLTRYIQWSKYKAALQIFGEQEAKVLAEPEDQDYYGMGSRSARWTIMLGIGLIFGTLSPPINVLCFINFFVCRVVYGYLVVFAETRKPDTGGHFFVTSLLQTFPLLIIYVILMAAVFYQRAASLGPCVIAALSLVWVFASHSKFQGYTWEKLPMLELQASKDDKKRPDTGPYVQPELLEK